MVKYMTVSIEPDGEYKIMKKHISFIRNNVTILVVAPIVGLLLMLLVHFLPTDTMRQNVYWSMDMIIPEFTDELVVEGYRSTLTGNFTDCLMLHHAIYSNEEHSSLEQVLHMYRSESYNVEGDPTGWEPGRSLFEYLNDIEQPREVEYGRYWHGYLVILKPLLLFTSFNTIRLLNGALQLIAAGFIVIGLTRKKAEPLAKAFLVSLPFMFFISTFSSLSLSICFYLMAVALLAQLKWDEKLYKKNLYYVFFLMVGIATSYFDFLTYPLVTLAYPLCVYLYFHGGRLKEQLRKSFLFCMEWGIGYVGMWASKWLLCDLLSDSSTIKDALDTIGTRTQSAQGGYGFGGFTEVLQVNIAPFMNRGYLVILFIVLLLAIIGIFRNGIMKSILKIRKTIPYLAIAILPFIWYLATQNHSVQHWQYTCRIIAITVFAGVTALQIITGQKETLK